MPSLVANDPACAAISRREMSPKNIRQPSGGREGDVDAVVPPPPPWVRADQGKRDATAARNSQEVKKQGAVAPLSHRLDTLSRVEQPKHD